MIALMLDYAMGFIGVPYRWGGANPIQGFDCSGFVQECLAAIGRDPRGDQTAHDLWLHFHDDPCQAEPGALAFFGTSSKVTHVAICLTDDFMIEAGGGGRTVRDIPDAAARSAFVRIRPIRSRPDFLGCCRVVRAEQADT